MIKSSCCACVNAGQISPGLLEQARLEATALQQQTSQRVKPAKSAKAAKEPAAAGAGAGGQQQGLEAAAAKPKVKRKRAVADAKENCDGEAAQGAEVPGKKQTKQYIPAYMSANFAFLIVLFKVRQGPEPQGACDVWHLGLAVAPGPGAPGATKTTVLLKRVLSISKNTATTGLFWKTVLLTKSAT
jgi:hypothetical protein